MSANTLSALVEKRFTPDEVQSLTARAEQLLGRSLEKLLERHATAGSARPRRHRLIELLLRMREAAAEPDGLRAGVAAVNAPELHAILDLYDEWHGSAAWPEFQRSLNSPADFLHAVATLAMASQLRLRHPRTELVAAVGNDKHADLMLMVSEQHDLAMEVKAPQKLWQRDRALEVGEAMRIVRAALRDSQGQLSPKRPGVLVVAGFHLSTETFEVLTDGAEMVLQTLAPLRPYLLGIALQDFGVVAGMQKPGLASLWLVQRSRLGHNHHYRGRVRLVGKWDGDWTLVAS
jgi:hypothetical protein